MTLAAAVALFAAMQIVPPPAAYDADARARMRDLGDEMRVLGNQMRDEGEKIDKQLRVMMPDLIKRGIAREMVR